MSYEQDPDNPSSGLWKNEDGKPAGYGGSITVGGVDYFVNLYKNDRKEPGSKQPDLNLRLKRKEKQGNGTPRNNAPQPARRDPAPQSFEPDNFQDQDIPFASNRSVW